MVVVWNFGQEPVGAAAAIAVAWVAGARYHRPPRTRHSLTDWTRGWSAVAVAAVAGPVATVD